MLLKLVVYIRTSIDLIFEGRKDVYVYMNNN